MKKFATAFVLTLILATSGFAQYVTSGGIGSGQLIAGGTPAALPGVSESANVSSTHYVAWAVTGSISACTLQFETSSNNLSYSLMSGSTAQTCTASGGYIVTGQTANFVRVNVTAITGTGTVLVSFYSTPNTPVGISALQIADAVVGLQNFPFSVFLAAQYTNATTTFSNVTGMAFPIAPGQSRHAVCRVVWQGSAGTTGPKYQFTGPSAPTGVLVGLNSIVTATTVITATVTAFATPVANSGTVTTATNFVDTIDVSIINGTTAGTVQLQAAANGAGTLTIQTPSTCFVQ